MHHLHAAPKHSQVTTSSSTRDAILTRRALIRFHRKSRADTSKFSSSRTINRIFPLDQIRPATSKVLAGRIHERNEAVPFHVNLGDDLARSRGGTHVLVEGRLLARRGRCQLTSMTATVRMREVPFKTCR